MRFTAWPASRVGPRLQVANLARGRQHEAELRGRLLDALAGGEPGLVEEQPRVLALECRDPLRVARDVAVHLEQVDVEEDDSGEQHEHQRDPAAAGEECVEQAAGARAGGACEGRVEDADGKRDGGRARGGAGHAPAHRAALRGVRRARASVARRRGAGCARRRAGARARRARPRDAGFARGAGRGAAAAAARAIRRPPSACGPRAAGSTWRAGCRRSRRRSAPRRGR